ncbi:hypothetical protein AVEN_236941-1 [Araneus ventricosus]|uniref:Uncharacterized protein n=1 Tax=Araneus ventricosus TaxID=182803 RepID=A0A4Y2LI81_ARAVE|nr:hypothetical protein AVEN_236941-1 [Araneus ventricosus]
MDRLPVSDTKYQVNVSYPWRVPFQGMDRLPAVSSKSIKKMYRSRLAKFRFKGNGSVTGAYPDTKVSRNVSVPDWQFRFKGMDRLPAVSDKRLSSKCIGTRLAKFRFKGEWIGYRLYQIQSINKCIGD